MLATPKIKSRDYRYSPVFCEWRLVVPFAGAVRLAAIATEGIKYLIPSYFSEYIVGEFVCLANKKRDFKEVIDQLYHEIYS